MYICIHIRIYIYIYAQYIYLYLYICIHTYNDSHVSNTTPPQLDRSFSIHPTLAMATPNQFYSWVDANPKIPPSRLCFSFAHTHLHTHTFRWCLPFETQQSPPTPPPFPASHPPPSAPPPKHSAAQICRCGALLPEAVSPHYSALCGAAAMACTGKSPAT